MKLKEDITKKDIREWFNENNIVERLQNLGVLSVLSIEQKGKNDMTEKERLLEIGGGDVFQVVTVEELPYILEAYADYLKDTFYIEEDFRSLAPNGTLSDRQTAENFLKETSVYG